MSCERRQAKARAVSVSNGSGWMYCSEQQVLAPSRVPFRPLRNLGLPPAAERVSGSHFLAGLARIEPGRGREKGGSSVRGRRPSASRDASSRGPPAISPRRLCCPALDAARRRSAPETTPSVRPTRAQNVTVSHGSELTRLARKAGRHVPGRRRSSCRLSWCPPRRRAACGSARAVRRRRPSSSPRQRRGESGA